MLRMGEYAAVRVLLKCLWLTPLLLLLANPAEVWCDAPTLIGVIRSDTTKTLFADHLSAAGDVTGDGYPDILVSTGRPFNWLYRGGPTLDTLPFMRFDSTNPWHSPIGDIDGDGWPDMAIPCRDNGKYKMGIFLGGLQLDTIRDYWFGRDGNVVGTFGTAVDIDMDGHKEFVAVENSRQKAYVFRLAPWDSLPWLVLPTLNRKGAFAYKPAVGDLDGDGHDDLAIGLPMADDTTANGRVYIYFSSPAIDSLPDLIIVRPGEWEYGLQYFGELVVCPGDINGDGYDDLLATSGGAGGDPLHYIYFGGPAFDTVPDVILDRYFSKAVAAGDLNGDSYADLLTSGPLPWSGSGTVYIWHGGPTFDNIPDERLDNWQFLGYHVEFGRDIVGLGDFNGDGVDDFAFSMYDADTRGLIYIYSGTGIPVDVPDEPNNLPANFYLHPNYPNPFNPSTTISFDLPRRARVTLSIVNILGQEVKRLIDQVMSAGSHSVAWDGRDGSGEPAASGVYLYRLETDEGILSRKMLLLK